MRDPSVRVIRTNPAFGWYWLGQTVSSAGSQVALFALPLVTAAALGGSAAEVGLVAAAATLPYLLFSLLAGHLLEGRPRRRTMVAADLAQAALIGVIPVAWVCGVLSVPLVAVIAFLSGTAALCFGVVGFSFVPDLVGTDDLAAANRALQGSRTVTEVVAPAGAGVLVGALGAPIAMVATAVGHLVSAFGVFRARPASEHPSPASTGRPDSAGRIFDGLRILFTDRHLRPLTLHAAIYNLAEQILLLNLVLWAVQQQHVPAAVYGVALGAIGLGALVGTVTSMLLSARIGLGPAFLVSLVLSCGTPLLTAVWPLEGLPLAIVIAAIMFVSGVGLGNANVYSLTLRQSVIAKDQLTRSAGAYTQVMYGSIPIGSALAGVIGQGLGSRAAVMVGAIGLVLSIVPMLTPAMLRLRDTAAVARAG